MSWLKPASFPDLTHCGNAKVAALLGLGWTEFKMSSLNRLNRTGPTRRPVKPMGAEREMPFALAVGQAQKNSNRTRILARMAGRDRAPPEDSCDAVFSLLPVGSRSSRGKLANATEKVQGGDGAGAQGRFGRSAFLHLYFPFVHRDFLKQEQSVKCLRGHSNPIAAIVPKCMDSGSA
jgi:hypothetical protein